MQVFSPYNAITLSITLDCYSLKSSFKCFISIVLLAYGDLYRQYFIKLYLSMRSCSVCQCTLYCTTRHLTSLELYIHHAHNLCHNQQKQTTVNILTSYPRQLLLNLQSVST